MFHTSSLVLPPSSSRRSQIAERLAQLARQLGAGAQLPPMAQLRRDLGVSMTALSEGVRELEEQGVLTRRHRVGLFVAAGAREGDVSAHRSDLRSALLSERPFAVLGFAGAARANAGRATKRAFGFSLVAPIDAARKRSARRRSGFRRKPAARPGSRTHRGRVLAQCAARNGGVDRKFGRASRVLW